MNSTFKSTVILGSTSVVTLFVGLLATKCWAVLLGPSGFGYFGLLQNLLLLAGMVAGLGVGTGVVRFGAQALAQRDAARVEALRRGSWLLTAVLGGASVILLTLGRRPVGRWMLAQDGDGSSVVLVGVALLFNLGFSVFSGWLNAHHRVPALARLNLLNRVVGAGVGVLLIAGWGERGIVPAVVAGAVLGWAIAWRLFVREVWTEPAQVTRPQTRAAVRDLVRFGGPYTASMLVGTGVQLLVPVMVLRTLGLESVGWYRAVGLVSTAYLGFLLTAMTQDYYPRLSAVSQHPGAVSQLINEQHQLVIVLAGPLILIILAASPILIPLIYTSQFSRIISVLEWQMIGDVLKFSSWTMGFVLLARNKSGLYFIAESVGGGVTLVSTWYAMRWFGLDGVGMAYLTVYAVYFCVVWYLVRQETGMRLTPMNRRLLGLTILSVGLVRLVSWCGPTGARTPVAWGLAAGATLGSLWLIQKHYGAWKWIKCLFTIRPAN